MRYIILGLVKYEHRSLRCALRYNLALYTYILSSLTPHPFKEIAQPYYEHCVPSGMLSEDVAAFREVYYAYQEAIGRGTAPPERLEALKKRIQAFGWIFATAYPDNEEAALCFRKASRILAFSAKN